MLLRFGLRHPADIADARLAQWALLLCVPLCLVYGAAGLAYGHLPLPTPFGFIDMAGPCAWLVATASLALAVAALQRAWAGPPAQPSLVQRTVLTAHTIRRTPGGPPEQVMLKTALPPEVPAVPWHRGLHAACLLVAAIAIASALVVRALLAMGFESLAQPDIALAPRAQWPLWPLPVAWPWLLPFARDLVVAGLVGIGAALLLLCWLISRRGVRGAWLPLGVAAPLLVALAHLGSAGYDYATARGLGPLRDAGAVMALANAPGLHNVYTFLSLWIAAGCASVGTLAGFGLARAVVPQARKK